ncbi:MAG: hypothetical protein HOP91_07090 [Sphingomonas sp.]|nr:hypothetical protein [Sphingomonas sp.]
MRRLPFVSLAVILMLAGCDKHDPVDNQAAKAAASLPEINSTAPTSIGEPHVNTQTAGPLPAAAATIPPALQGRWGLSPGDCMTGHGDAKGLLVVTPTELRFYESRAVPSENIETDPDSIAGNFAFTGEGQSWNKYESLKIEKQVLVRTETKPMASFSYAKCS